MFAQTLAAAFIALPFFARSALAGDCTRSYTIRAGDICDSISEANQVPTYQLSAINSGIIDETCSNLVPGMSICLGYAGEDCSTTYAVRALDTCDIIAANAGLNSTILYLNNPQINEACDNIYIGEVLCVSQSVQVPPAPAGSFVPGATIPTTATPASLQTPAKAPVLSSSVAPVASPTPAPVTTPAPATSAPAVKTPTGAAQTPATGDDEDEDDEDLPFCDEIDN